MASSGAISISILVLRMLALGLLGASIALLATDKVTLDDDSKVFFHDIIAYRFVLATAAAGCLYTLIQVPFAVYHVVTEKRMIRNDCLPEFDFYGDKIISLLLGTGVGAGFAVSFEYKKLTRDNFRGFPGTESKLNKFFDRANIASCLLLAAFVCYIHLSILSSIIKASTSRKFSFFG